MQQEVQEHQRRAERIETLLQEVASFPDPGTRATTEELVQTLLDMYGEGLARIVEQIEDSAASGHALIEMLARDDLVSSLFLLHGLHPLDIEARITRALVEVRSYLKSNGSTVELVRVEDSVAYLRLEGSSRGCSAPAHSLKQTIEEAIYKAVPDLEGLHIESAIEPARTAVPITFVPRRRSKEASTK